MDTSYKYSLYSKQFYVEHYVQKTIIGYLKYDPVKFQWLLMNLNLICRNNQCQTDNASEHEFSCLVTSEYVHDVLQ